MIDIAVILRSYYMPTSYDIIIYSLCFVLCIYIGDNTTTDHDVITLNYFKAENEST